MRKCVLCGRELPAIPWWKFWADKQPYCRKSGAEGYECWLGLNKRLGVKNPGPMPR